MGHSSRSFRVLRSALALAFAAGTTVAVIPTSTAAAASAITTYATPSVQTAGFAAHGGIASKQSRSITRGARTPHAAAAAALAQGTASGAAGTSQGEGDNANGLVRAFNGVSSLDSLVTNSFPQDNFFGQFEPPDQGLCAGNGFVIEPVNSAYTIYRTDGRPIAGPFNVNDLFHRGGEQFTSDPRCYYDAATNTWFATILFIADDNQSSTIDISVNPSGDPTTAWTTYSIDTSDAANTANGCPCFGDQPRFGIDNFNLYLSTDEFSILGPQFNGAQLYAVSKRDLVGLRNRIHFVHFTDPQINGGSTFAIEPATTVGSADAEYFLGALDENLDGSTVNQIGVWAMTNRDRLSQGKAPTLTSEVISSEAYSVPPKAEQKGNPAQPLDSGDDRMQQAQFVNGTIWAELDTALSIPGDATARAGAAWFNVRPTLAGDRLGSATMTRQGYVALKGNYVLYPAIQADQNGNAAMVVSVSSANRYPSAAFTTMRSGASNFGPIRVAAAGTGPYRPKPNQAGRWGDYSYASLDAPSDTVWLATEYVPPVSSQTPNGLRNWGTEVIQVALNGGD